MATKKKATVKPWRGRLVFRRNRIYIELRRNEIVKGLSFPHTPEGERQAQLALGKLATEREYRIIDRIINSDTISNEVTKSCQPSQIPPIEDATSSPKLPKKRKANKNIHKLFQAFLFHKQNKRRPLSPKTLRSYDLAFRMIVRDSYMIDDIVEAVPLDAEEATEMYHIEKDIIDYIRTNESLPDKKKVSFATVNIYLRSLQVFLHWCSLEHYLPMKLEMYHKYHYAISTKEVHVMAPHEYKLLLQEFDNRDPDFANWLRVMRSMGGRATESMLLKKKQFQWRHKLIALPNKTKKNETEYLPITSTIEQVYRDQCKRYPYSETLFPMWTEKSMAALTRKLQRAKRRLGIPVRRGEAFHILRKTFTDSLFDMDLSLDEIKDAARHRSIDTTLTHYRIHRARKLGQQLEAAAIAAT